MIDGQKVLGVTQELGTWDFWQIVSVSLFVLIPILCLVGFIYYIKTVKPMKAKANGNGAKPENGSLNGKARLEDISKDLRGLHLEVAGVREVVDQNALNLETYKREVDKKIAEKDAVDVEQREKIKALERTVYNA